MSTAKGKQYSGIVVEVKRQTRGGGYDYEIRFNKLGCTAFVFELEDRLLCKGARVRVTVPKDIFNLGEVPIHISAKEKVYPTSVTVFAGPRTYFFRKE